MLEETQKFNCRDTNPKYIDATMNQIKSSSAAIQAYCCCTWSQVAPYRSADDSAYQIACKELRVTQFNKQRDDCYEQMHHNNPISTKHT